jgi:hypothetical protein
VSRVEFPQPAKGKFEGLKRHGFELTPRQVEVAALTPDKGIPPPQGRVIAEKRVMERHVPRVVSRQEGEVRAVSTF